MSKIALLFIIGISSLFFLSNCTKWIEVSPPNSSLTGATVYESNKTAVAVVNGIYSNMSNGSFTGGTTGISFQSALLSDESFLSPSITGILRNLNENNLTSQENYGPWTNLYSHLQAINTTLEGLNRSMQLNSNLKKQLEGELKFLRAFCYFYLLNFYGDVPLALTSDWKANTTSIRAAKAKVWDQMVTDLLDAKKLLSEDYLMADALTKYETGAIERVRPTKWAASTLLARVYLYTNQWANSENQATEVIDKKDLFEVVKPLENVFLKNSREAIWQLMPVATGQNTKDAMAFILTSGGFNVLRPAFLPSMLYDSFQNNDLRKTRWISSVTINGSKFYFPFKYKVRTLNAPITEYLMVMRLSELYLIRAEARAQQNNIVGGVTDLNVIRSKANLSDTTLVNTSDLVNAITKERRLELFSEWGHRWLDLKRLGLLDQVMEKVTPMKANGKPWRSYQQLLPLFIGDIRVNPNLGSNNPGYE